MPPETVYSIQLRQSKSYYHPKNGVYCLADADAHGCLTKKYVVVECLTTEDTSVYVCSCDSDQGKLLRSAAVRGNVAGYDDMSACMHAAEVMQLWPDHSDILCDDSETEDYGIYQLNTTHFCVYSDSSQSYGIVFQGPRSTKCVTCHTKVTSCSHVKKYRSKATEHGLNFASKDDLFSCESSLPIPYPLGDKYAQLFGLYASSTCQYPHHLIPAEGGSMTCTHGNIYDDRDPVEQDWILNEDASIHTKHATRSCIIYFRPSLGDCNCRLTYDGRQDLLLNLDNNQLFSYVWLFDILHDAQETRYPLAAAFRSANRTRSACGMGPLGYPYMYNCLRIAYNCFLRLLALDFKSLFKCDDCGPDVDAIIMDGIMMGSRQDLLPVYDSPEPGLLEMPELPISQRVLVTDATARRLLAQYTSLKKGRYSKCQKMPKEDYKQLCESLRKTPSVYQVVYEAGPLCPASHQVLLGELSRGSSTCGIFQLADPDFFANVRGIIRRISEGNRVVAEDDRAAIERTCPLLLPIITADDIRDSTLASLLVDLLAAIDSPFNQELPDDRCYGEPCTMNEALEFFPNNPLQRGVGRYAADAKKQPTVTGCRKETSSHATLTPGLFTMFCPHGICLGFQMMESAESPRTAFDILTRRFTKMPRLIIYDNACKLHLYCLKREPARFRNTRFMVDRLHFRKGHVGCSLGYCMDSYSADSSIVNLNSQVNEQANSSLRRLSTQLAYMPPGNVMKHTSVFLALRNLDKML